jgi:HEPN domain-containing protein
MVSTAKTYYSAALERIEDAHLLHTEGHYTFAMFASGLAVECLLRAFRLLRDDERHDLWELWRKTALKDTPSQSAMIASTLCWAKLACAGVIHTVLPRKTKLALL